MLHNVRLIQRHFPNHARAIIVAVAAASLGGVLLGAGLLLLG